MEHTNASSQTGKTQQSFSEIDSCAQICFECYKVCTKTAKNCLLKGGKHSEQMHISLLEDCAKICATSVDFLIRSSTLHSYTCEACAAICEQCAEECNQMGDDQDMQSCGEICVRCAESCRNSLCIKTGICKF